MNDTQYQVIIVGGGPAGLTAGIYVTRAGLKALLLERGMPGGQITTSELVENYPGFPQGISGFELGQLMEEQAVKLGLEIRMAEVSGIEISGSKKMVKADGEGFYADAVIIAGGTEHAKLGIPGEERLMGRGLSCCATCDGPLFGGRTVAVVGGGDVAVSDALFLSRFASKVYVVHRRNQLRATKILQDRAFADPKIEFVWDTVVEAIEGESLVSSLQLRNVSNDEKSALPVDGVFMAVGTSPNTKYLQGVLKLGSGGEVPVNHQMETEVEGVFAAGDIRQGSIRQVIAAAGDGAVAAISAQEYLMKRA